MLTVRAHVKNGRLVLDEPTDLPEGSEVELEAVVDPRQRVREAARAVMAENADLMARLAK